MNARCEHKVNVVKYFGPFISVYTCCACGKQYLHMSIYWPWTLVVLIVIGLVLGWVL